MTLFQLFTAIANAIRSKKGTQSTIAAEDFPDEIADITTGNLTDEEYEEANNDLDDILENTTVPSDTISITENGIHDVTNYANADVNVKGSLVKADVNFYDYDGTLTNSYTKTEFLALESLPANPNHTGLVAQGWNWTLADAKTYVTNNDKLNIGQMYTTVSGLSEFDIELTAVTGLTAKLNMDGTKDWGDGTTDTLTTHTYLSTGKYTIKCNGTTMTTSSSSGLFGGTNYYVKNVRLANITTITPYAFNLCISIVNVAISNSVTTISMNAFINCRSLTSITLPNNISSLGDNMFSNCYSLESVTLPKNISNSLSSMFSNCYSLTSVTLPSRMTSIGNSMFSNCYSLKSFKLPKGVNVLGTTVFNGCIGITLYDFSNQLTRITLNNVNAFTGINQAAKIVVPDNLYNSYKTASNWSTYADYIVKASEV